MGRNHQRHDVAVQLQTHHSFFPWDTKANKASGKSLESQRINEKLENIKTNISKAVPTSLRPGLVCHCRKGSQCL